MNDAAHPPDKRNRQLLGRLRLALPQLHRLLRAEGFAAGPDRWQNAYDLLLELQAHGRMPADPAALRPLLSPLFCRTADEQSAFERVYREWLAGQERGSTVRENRTRVEPAPEPPPKPRLRPVILGVVLAALAVAGISYTAIRLAPVDQPVQVLPKWPKPPSNGESGGGDTQAVPVREPQALPPRMPLEQPQLNSGNRAFLKTSGLLVALLPALGLFAVLVARWLFWTMVLRRRSSGGEVPLTAPWIWGCSASNPLLHASGVYWPSRACPGAVPAPCPTGCGRT